MGFETIRNLDMYKKVPTDLTERTACGAFISVACVILTVYLMFAELVLYANGSLHTSIFVSYLNQEDDIEVRLNVSIVDKDCQDLSVNLRHLHGHQENIPINKVQVAEDCNINGMIKIKKTPGIMMIVPHHGKNWTGKEYKIVPENREKPIITPKGFIPTSGYTPPEGYKVVEVIKSLKMNHAIHEFEFGPSLHSTHRWEEVLPVNGTPFRPLAGVSREYPVNLAHDYHIRMVPTTFIDQNKRRTDTYQYSYAYQNFVMATPAGIAPPCILFRYDLAPMEIRYQYDRKPVYHLLTMICAIVGGVVTLAGVVDKILFNTHQLIKQKLLLGKQS
ncbi:endoplasmic reticulum-Golgi intermediate compartment protein 1-like [Bolinopsis microptera]|uniref:endoplasmic reticulum-Golgi intermediate compartment protein 1-like n=1 Tax=Bolinopsis microptera TaxID=2820187 RepID=UPI003079705D